jgi:hypothetical protein
LNSSVARPSPRRAVVYEVVSQPGTFHVRAELYPEHTEPSSRWFGGRVLWGHDQPTEALAQKLAGRWVKEGLLPEEMR